jgi:hypothetical protein
MRILDPETLVGLNAFLTQFPAHCSRSACPDWQFQFISKYPDQLTKESTRIVMFETWRYDFQRFLIVSESISGPFLERTQEPRVFRPAHTIKDQNFASGRSFL